MNMQQQLAAISNEKQPVLRQSIGLVMVGFMLGGVLYCAVNVSIAQIIFPEQANGSLIEHQGKMVGSALVAQPFTGQQYFHPRPSAVSYNPQSVGGSNLAVSNPDLQQQITERRTEFAHENGINPQDVPNEMLTASGSGIDPDISPQSALLQLKRVAQHRQLTEQQVENVVKQHIQPKQFGLFGQERVNVLQLNLALDQLQRPL
ncbi:potassium-transporting ATPase subunit KdpC [Acinetobacter sp. VNH17]|uniref:Potassium-transporting ATPase KdpC subunit n=1 Tax=Acinetobacter thutiue TaxID=2998078 RepID=A0ABT7WJJ5_9GAMM|nr:potassium-transporting ATPase subunit KdpC [Acinetobacter thutiue]MCY6410748.1 potassium-transporting ATPase subunit KdpC [Acinetobacter thutiue]MDN0012850.1 potassium-transporting ATPase subunit KdpC [Acinetobacter thutiue]